MNEIKLSNSESLVFIQVPVSSTGIYLSRTGLIWYETEDRSCGKQKRDYSLSRDNCVILGEITSNGDVSSNLRIWCINRINIPKLMSANKIELPSGGNKYIVLLKKKA